MESQVMPNIKIKNKDSNFSKGKDLLTVREKSQTLLSQAQIVL